MLRSNTVSTVTVLVLLGLITTSSCLVVPAGADNAPTTISVEDPVTLSHVMEVTVGSTFKVDVWMRSIPKPGVVGFRFKMTWNPELIGYVSREVDDHGFGVFAETTDQDRYEVEFVSPFPHSGFTNEVSWVTFTFRCLGEGSSEILIEDPNGYYGDYGHELNLSPENATVNQHPLGENSSGDSVQALFPWLVVIGLVAVIVVMAVVARNRRNRNRPS
jgi:hypothetical protein